MASYENFQTDKRKKNSTTGMSNEVNQGVLKKDKLTKNERLMEGVAAWASYYRVRPDIMARDFGLNLKEFQGFLLCEMFDNNYFMFLASRSLGKTFLTAVFCILIGILYPGIKIVVASGVKGQAMKIVSEKIPEILAMAPLLGRELLDVTLNMSTQAPNVTWRNGSTLKVVASNENARSGRANILILDEFRQIPIKVYQSTLRRFQGVSRHPPFMDLPEYSDYKLERNKEIFLTSAYYKHNWAYERYKVFRGKMLEGKKYKVYALPYQTAIKNRLQNKQQLMDELSENDRDPITWGMEMDVMFHGQSDNAFFDYENLEMAREAYPPIYPLPHYNLFKSPKFKQPYKKDGEIRVLCADIALMGGKQNDASAFYLLQLIPDKMGYIRRISYGETMVGGHTVTQALKIKQLFYDLDCDYLVLDKQGGGMGIYDQLVMVMYDKERGTEYAPWVSMNNDELKIRCQFPDAKPVIFTVNATADMNDEIARKMRDGITRRRIQFLGDKNDMLDYFDSIQDFSTASVQTQVKLELPFAETDSLINEMITLERVENSNAVGKSLIKLQTVGRNRKDRYSAVSYGNYFATILEKDLLAPKDDTSLIDYFKLINAGGSSSGNLTNNYFR